MSLALLIAVASVGAAVETADLEGSPGSWTVGITGNYARTENLDADSGSVGGFVEYGAPGWFAGGSIAATDGASLAESYDSPSDGRGVTGSAWIGWSVDAWTIDVTASLGRQDLDGETVAGPDAPDLLQGRSVLIEGETVSSSISLGVARDFNLDTVFLTPHARAGWDRVTTDTTARLTGTMGGGLAVDSEASGATASAGLTVTVWPTTWVSLFADASGVYASSEAASAFTLGGRTSQMRPTSGSDDGAGWAELSAGASFYAPGGVTFAVSGEGTAGRDAEDVFASVSLSKAF